VTTLEQPTAAAGPAADGLPMTIADAAVALRDGSLTATALTEGILARVAALDSQLGAYVCTGPEAALAAAARADADFAAGIDHGPLQGIPLAIKDIIATKDAPTTANSRVLAPDWGAGTDAPVAARLRAAGAVFVGKATTSEFALGAPDPDKGFPIPHNPWELSRTAGGSSSGTGVAVAAGLALGGLGTDTGGSVRFPAAMNGHTGLKVTFGRVPKSGVVPLGFSLDSIGPMARSAYDCALLLQVMAGYDGTDPDAADTAVDTDYTSTLDGSVEGVTLGVPMPYFFDADGLDPEVRDSVLAAIAVLTGAGAVATDTEIPYAEQAKNANMLTLAAEAYAYHRNNMVSRWGDYGQFTRPGLARGVMYSAADYAQAQRFRGWFRRAVATLLATYDVLVTPTWATPAFPLTEMLPERMILTPGYTPQWNFTGLPAVAVPCGFSSDGLPLSMQIIGRPFAEATVLKVADAFQRLTDWHLRVPPIAGGAA
jgi:aspartyl-tRNA(Asn)/glutamyl-tRNA(Gln) amidotransferase subunit A